jgi:hypothetical protein
MVVLRAWVVSALAVPLFACAQEMDAEPARQLSTTQAHLQEMRPPARKTAAATPTLLRLLGKALSEQFKGVSVDLDPVPNQAAALSSGPGMVHLNRRAEICFDNYRLGLRRDGVVMRYELSF